MGFQVVHRLGLRIFTYSWFLARGIAVASIASGFIVFVADVRILFLSRCVLFFLFCLIQQELRGCFVLKLGFMHLFPSISPTLATTISIENIHIGKRL